MAAAASTTVAATVAGGTMVTAAVWLLLALRLLLLWLLVQQLLLFSMAEKMFLSPPIPSASSVPFLFSFSFIDILNLTYCCCTAMFNQKQDEK